ncbi:MAG: FAD-binding oxidoreductase [Candidatus Nezhaarchaeales archaeon]|nr:MAG: FAD-binding oxidoreductase [Candidatus Nezhaarchaeota archaeon WYZ-LMO8]
MNKKEVHKALAEIVGEEYVSDSKEDLYIYSRDPGLAEPHEADFVVLPKTVEEVQKIVQLANKERIPVIPAGASLSLSGLTIPYKGGIVIDLRRMDKIIEVNRRSRYVVIEAGVTHGKLKAFLEEQYPDLCHSLPEAPPSATVVGNLMIHGQGHLAQQYGFNSSMVTGLEIVLSSGEICRIGSCALGSYWFSLEPFPIPAGLFLGWFGATGIVTKAGLRLYPKKKLRDVEVFVVEDPNLVPEVIYRVTHTEMAEDITTSAQPYPLMFRDIVMIQIYITGDEEEELEFKRKLIWSSLRDIINSKEGGFMTLAPNMKIAFLERPMSNITRFADVLKGGGFVYCGAIIPIDMFSTALKKLFEIASRNQVTFSHTGRVIGRGHCMMFSFAYPFNREDPESMEKARKAIQESYIATLEIGGIPWKPEPPIQRVLLEKMPRETAELLKRIRSLLDPNGIMNPGNWSV